MRSCNRGPEVVAKRAEQVPWQRVTRPGETMSAAARSLSPSNFWGAPKPNLLLGGWYGSLARQVADLRAAAGAVPPTGLVLASMLSVQVGAAPAKGLFPTLGPAGTGFLR